jgi:hypothetical protein
MSIEQLSPEETDLYHVARETFLGEEKRPGDVEGWDLLAGEQFEQYKAQNDGDEVKASAAMERFLLDMIKSSPEAQQAYFDYSYKTGKETVEKVAKQITEGSPEIGKKTF